MHISQVKAGAVLNYVTIGINTLVGLLYTPFMLHALGQSEYGMYSIVSSVISYLTILDFGFGTAVIRYCARFRAEGEESKQYELFGFFFIVYLFIGLVALMAGLFVCSHIDGLFATALTAEELAKSKVMMIILVFNLAITFPMSLFPSIIQAHERFVFNKSVNILRILLNTMVMILLLKIGYKAIAMVITQTVFNVATLTINCVYCFKKLHIKIRYPHFENRFIREIVIYSMWIFLAVVMDKVYWSSGQVVLGAVSGTAQVAVYALAMQLTIMYISFSTSISTVVLPKVTMLAAKGLDGQVSDLFIRTGRLQSGIMFLVLSGFIIFGNTFIQLWAGPEYRQAYILAVCLFVPYTIDLIQNVGITILQAYNKLKFRSILFAVMACLCIVLEVWLSKEMGALGCALSIGICILLGQGICMNLYYWKKIKLDIPAFWKSVCKIGFPVFVLMIFAYYVISSFKIDTWLSLIIAIVVYSLLYVVIVLFMSITSEERKSIVFALRKLRK